VIHSLIHVDCKALTRAVLSSMNKSRVKNGKHLYIYRAHVTSTSNFIDSQDLSTFRADITWAKKTEKELK